MSASMKITVISSWLDNFKTYYQHLRYIFISIESFLSLLFKLFNLTDSVLFYSIPFPRIIFQFCSENIIVRVYDIYLLCYVYNRYH